MGCVDSARKSVRCDLCGNRFSWLHFASIHKTESGGFHGKCDYCLKEKVEDECRND